MTEKAYRFSPSAIDKLNKHRGAGSQAYRYEIESMASFVVTMVLA